MYAVSAKGLTKSYDGKTNALNDLNLDIPQGSVYGFLGRKDDVRQTVYGALETDAGRVYGA